MKVSLISLNLNGMPFLDAFLESVRLELDGFSDAELILLDNGSSDNSVSFVMNEYPWVRLVQSPRNLGFASGCHKAASESKAEFLIFVNNDMVLSPGFIDEILKPFEGNENIGAVAGLILNETGTQIDFAGGDANLFGWGFQKYHGEQASIVDEIETKDKYPAQFFPCGGTLAIKWDVWNLSGGFDPDYFAFFEDVDLGWRLNLMGYDVVLNPKAKVLHKHHGTAVAMPAVLRSYLLERNALCNVIKNYDDENLGEMLPWAISMTVERGLIETGSDKRDVFRGRWFDDIWGTPESDTESKSVKISKLEKAAKALRGSLDTARQSYRQLAIEEVFHNWESLMRKREIVQQLRKRSDSEIISKMSEPYRTVLGHSREKEMMELFRKNVHI